ncbi:MAG: hypothetical protein JOY60_13460 [Burkholderiaceae bacterium]|nr:hypothetical protein [Burkholderiaceae bacterium]
MDIVPNIKVSANTAVKASAKRAPTLRFAIIFSSHSMHSFFCRMLPCKNNTRWKKLTTTLGINPSGGPNPIHETNRRKQWACLHHHAYTKIPRNFAH